MTVHGHSRWGPTDQIGAGNLLTVEKRLAALQSVREGRIYDVSHEISMGAPFLVPNQTPFLLSMWASWRDSIKRRRALGATNDAGANVERIEMTAHVGTHIDALGHFSKGDRLYNGLSAADTVTDWGLERLGIEHAPPMITRGVLLDVAGCDGGQHLNPGRVVTPDELARAEEAAKVTLEPGDNALIRTGWGRYFGIDNTLLGANGHRPAWRALADRARRCGDRLRQQCGGGAAQPEPRHLHAGAPARAGRGGGVSDREPGAGRTGARRRGEFLFRPAGDQVPWRDRIAGAAGGDGVAGRGCPIPRTSRAGWPV
jgi:kynurenine formamidase